MNVNLLLVYVNCLFTHSLVMSCSCDVKVFYYSLLIQAPFIARLLLRHRWEEMTTNLDEEFTMFDLHTSATLPSRNGNSTVNFTLDPINEEDEDDDKSVGSHGEDWRSQEVSSGSSEPESD